MIKNYFLPGTRHTELEILSLAPRVFRKPDKDAHLRPIIQRPEGAKFYMLSLYSHRPWDVVGYVLDVLDYTPTYLKAEQNRAIENFAWLRRQKELNANPESKHLMRMYFEIFDRMFFARALTTQSYCLIETVLITSWDTDGDCTTHRDKDFRDLPPEYEIRIRIANISIRSDLPGPEARLNYYLGVLLHESIHALFGLYVCYDCPRCRAIALSEGAEGLNGHGAAFMRVAKRIQDLTALLEGGPIPFPDCSAILSHGSEMAPQRPPRFSCPTTTTEVAACRFKLKH